MSVLVLSGLFTSEDLEKELPVLEALVLAPDDCLTSDDFVA